MNNTPPQVIKAITIELNNPERLRLLRHVREDLRKLNQNKTCTGKQYEDIYDLIDKLKKGKETTL